MIRILNDIEARILGCLIEKEVTTPEYYPPSLNALKNACNQKSNREPVAAYDDAEVLQGVKSLQADGIVVISSGAGQRVRKYHHRFAEHYPVTKKEMYVLCELMLRGAQTVGEIRTHASRMYDYASLDEVNEALEELIDRPEPLVAKLPRQPGRKEHRYMHRLSGEPEIREEESALPEEPATLRLQTSDDRISTLENEIQGLREELKELRENFDKFRSQFE